MANEQDFEPLLGTQQNQLGIVIGEGSGIDGKSLAVAAINVAVLLFIAGADLGLHHWWQYALLVPPYVISLVFNALGLLPKKYLGAAVDIAKNPEYLEMDKDSLTLQLLADTTHAIAHNSRVNARYWRYCMASIVFTVIGTVVLFAIL